MELELRVKLLQFPEQAGVKCQSEVGVVAALEQQLLAPEAKQLLDFCFIFFDRGHIGLLVPGSPVEITEFAVGNTDIGGIGVAVYDPGDHIAGNVALPQLVARVHEFRSRGVFKKEHAFFRA